MQRIQDGYPCGAWEPDCAAHGLSTRLRFMNRMISLLYPHHPAPSFPSPTPSFPAPQHPRSHAPHGNAVGMRRIHRWRSLVAPLYLLPLDATHPGWVPMRRMGTRLCCAWAEYQIAESQFTWCAWEPDKFSGKHLTLRRMHRIISA